MQINSKGLTKSKDSDFKYVCLVILVMVMWGFLYPAVKVRALIGFVGVIALNITSEGMFSFSLGDVRVIFASLASVSSNLLCKKAFWNMDYQQVF